MNLFTNVLLIKFQSQFIILLNINILYITLIYYKKKKQVKKIFRKDFDKMKKLPELPVI